MFAHSSSSWQVDRCSEFKVFPSCQKPVLYKGCWTTYTDKYLVLYSHYNGYKVKQRQLYDITTVHFHVHSSCFCFEVSEVTANVWWWSNLLVMKLVGRSSTITPWWNVAFRHSGLRLVIDSILSSLLIQSRGRVEMHFELNWLWYIYMYNCSWCIICFVMEKVLWMSITSAGLRASGMLIHSVADYGFLVYFYCFSLINLFNQLAIFRIKNNITMTK